MATDTERVSRDDALAIALLMLEDGSTYDFASDQWEKMKPDPREKGTVEAYLDNVEELRKAVGASGYELMLYDRRGVEERKRYFAKHNAWPR